jgi:multicomponent Na+:H+ antiporter subunit D
MNTLVLPIVVPLFTAVILLLAPRRPRLQRWISFTGSLALAGAAIALFITVERDGIQVLQAGSWAAPFGISLVADLFAAMLVLATSLVGVAVAGSSFAGVDPRREGSGYHGLMNVLLMGVSGAFLTGDLFNLYVWFEVMLVASFVLMALIMITVTRPEQTETSKSAAQMLPSSYMMTPSATLAAARAIADFVML